MTSPPMRRYDLLRAAAARLARADSIPPAAIPAPSISPPCRHRPALPPLLRWASRIDGWPPALWMSLQALALWPVLHWAVQRFAADAATLQGLPSLGLLALAAARGKLTCNWPVRPGWLAAAAVLSLAITASVGVLPWPRLAAAAALAAGSSWAAFRASGTPVLPVLGLLGLSLPLEMPGLPQVFRAGGMALVPIWLAWLAAWTGCAAALWNRVPDLRFTARLPGVALAAMAGSLAYFWMLLSLDLGMRPAKVDGAGVVEILLTLASAAAVCAMVLRLMRSEVRHAAG